MKSISFTEFRKNASSIFSNIEKGESYYIIRHGKTIAEIKPTISSKNEPSWKNPALRLSRKGASLSELVLNERKTS